MNGTYTYAWQVDEFIPTPTRDLDKDFSGTLDLLPFDTQTCTIMMGLYAETAAELRLQWRAGRVALSNWQSACLVSGNRSRPRERSPLHPTWVKLPRSSVVPVVLSLLHSKLCCNLLGANGSPVEVLAADKTARAAHTGIASTETQ